MKINIITPVLLLSFIALISISCTANALPKVINPSYEMYDRDGEKGYFVTFEVSHDSISPSAVVINRVEQTISPQNKLGLNYKVNVISQSRKIINFRSKITNSENGIFFKTDTAQVFKPVDFKLLIK